MDGAAPGFTPLAAGPLGPAGAGALDAAARRPLLTRGLRLEALTIGWNLVEAAIGLAAALLSRSSVLFGFAVDSVVESLSGTIVAWRLAAERRGAPPWRVDRIEERARRLVGLSLFVLAAYVAFDAGHALWTGERARPSAVGIVLTSVSMVVMLFLARAKRRVAAALRSGALAADAFQTTACWWLSVVTLAGIALNAVFGWWWADPLAALGMTLLIAREGREAWRGEACGCAGDCR